ncbi:MAG: hypothetical protein M1830_009343 [Pleopsidium flavum]|nr:MAG: hypothetical protein M1830_009343 [Pleopsidium flavum]
MLLLKLFYIPVTLGFAIPQNVSPAVNRITRPITPYPSGFPTAPDECDDLSQGPSEDCLRVSRKLGAFFYDKSCTNDKRFKLNTAFYDAFALANHAKGWPNIVHGSQTANYYMGPDYISPTYQQRIADNIQRAADFFTTETNDYITIVCNDPKNYCQRKVQDPNNPGKSIPMKIGGYAWTYSILWWYYHNINMCDIFYDISTIANRLDQGPDHANDLAWFQTSGSFVLHEMMHTRLINRADPHIGDEFLDPDGAPGDRRAYGPKFVHRLARIPPGSPNKGGAQRSSTNADSYAQLFSALYWWATWDIFPRASGEALNANTVDNSLYPRPSDEADDFPVMISMDIVNGVSNVDALFDAAALGYGSETSSIDLSSATATPQPPKRQLFCHGVSEHQWIVSRDVAVQNTADFCKQASTSVEYNQGSPNDLRLSLPNTVNPSLLIPAAPDCLDRFVLLLDSCDGNYTSSDGWLYSITPLAIQTKADDYEVSYRFLFNTFERRGKNFPDALPGEDGMGLLSQLRGCGPVTEWSFEITPKEPTYQWYAHGHLLIGTKRCVGRATVSAGGITAGNCQGAE